MTSEETDLTAWQAAGDALIRDGITVAPVLFAAEADYLRQAFIEGTEPPRLPSHGITPVSLERGAATGSKQWNYISVTDPVLMSLVLHPGLLDVLARYYGSQPLLRRMPYVKRTHIEPHHSADIASVYHIDQATHFCSIMMLLSDLSDQQTHMRYLVGTHHIEQPDFRLKPNDPRNQELAAELESKYPLYKLVGPKGSMFIYDNGNGIHKGNMVFGTTRDVMQATYSRGEHVSKPTDRDLMAENLRTAVEASSPLIRGAVARII